MSWRGHMGGMERDGKIWEKHVGKAGMICQNKKIIGKRYHWKWHIEIPKYDKDEKWCQNMQLSACNKMWQKYKKSKKSNRIL